MSDQSAIERYRRNLQEEINSAAMYRVLAAAEKDPHLAAVYAKMGGAEEQHALFWQTQLQQSGEDVVSVKPDRRTRILIWLARRLGAQILLQMLLNAEISGTSSYQNQAEVAGTTLVSDERSHSRALRVAAKSASSGLAGTFIARLEGRHKAMGGNALRAAVLGANDGLVSNLSLVMGVAGAQLSSQGILITGSAGLLAGAISMALGEWLSVQSSRELFTRQLQIEEEELSANPQEEQEELALIYQAKGLSEQQARMMANQLLSDKNHALDTLAREELGIDPEELGGSAWEAAFTSFLLFAIGAIIPVLPFLFYSGTTAVWLSLAGSAIGLFAIGASITLLTGRGILFSGARQMLFGLIAAAVTFGIGHILGVTIAG